jgi:hypothetical protein
MRLDLLPNGEYFLCGYLYRPCALLPSGYYCRENRLGRMPRIPSRIVHLQSSRQIHDVLSFPATLYILTYVKLNIVFAERIYAILIKAMGGQKIARHYLRHRRRKSQCLKHCIQTQSYTQGQDVFLPTRLRNLFGRGRMCIVPAFFAHG